MSSINIIITRPPPAADQTKHFLMQNGFDKSQLITAPLLTIEHKKAQDPAPNYDAIIFTSANAIKATQNLNINKPAFVVGDKTQEAAKLRGFKTIYNASGTAKDLEILIRQQASKDTNFYFPRAQHIAYDLKSALSDYAEITEQITYETKQVQNLPANLTSALKNSEPTIILLYSKRTAQSLYSLTDKYKLQDKIGKTKLLCISPSVLKYVQSDKNGHLWQGTYSANTPDENGLLEMLKNLTTQAE